MDLLLLVYLSSWSASAVRPVFAVMNNAALDNGVQSLCESMYKSLWHVSRSRVDGSYDKAVFGIFTLLRKRHISRELVQK